MNISRLLHIPKILQIAVLTSLIAKIYWLELAFHVIHTYISPFGASHNRTYQIDAAHYNTSHNGMYQYDTGMLIAIARIMPNLNMRHGTIIAIANNMPTYKCNTFNMRYCNRRACLNLIYSGLRLYNPLKTLRILNMRHQFMGVHSLDKCLSHIYTF